MTELTTNIHESRQEFNSYWQWFNQHATYKDKQFVKSVLNLEIDNNKLQVLHKFEVGTAPEKVLADFDKN